MVVNRIDKCLSTASLSKLFKSSNNSKLIPRLAYSTSPACRKADETVVATASSQIVLTSTVDNITTITMNNPKVCST